MSHPFLSVLECWYFSVLCPCLLLSRLTNSTWVISPNIVTLTVTPMLKTGQFIILKIFLSSVLELVSLYFLQLVILCLRSSLKNLTSAPNSVCSELPHFSSHCPRSAFPILFFNSATDSVTPSISISKSLEIILVISPSYQSPYSSFKQLSHCRH